MDGRTDGGEGEKQIEPTIDQIVFMRFTYLPSSDSIEYYTNYDNICSNYCVDIDNMRPTWMVLFIDPFIRRVCFRTAENWFSLSSTQSLGMACSMHLNPQIDEEMGNFPVQ